MDYLRENNTGTDQIISNVQAFLCSQTEENKQFCIEVFTKSLTCGVAAKTANKIYGKGFVPTFECMLAEKYFEYPKAIEGKDFTLTLKLDGIRCVAIKKNNKVTMYSRQGQVIKGLVDIENELNNLEIGDFMLDGELLVSDVAGIPSKEQYKATTKIVRKDGEKHGITYRVFDVLPIEIFEDHARAARYKIRRDFLEYCFSELNYIKVLPALYIGSDTSQIMYWLDKVRADGQEGIMINLNDAPYEFKRTQKLLKCKVMQDCDLKITGFEEGSGRLSGTLGRVNVDYKGNTLGVGGGFSDADRTYFWTHQNELLGRIITVQFFEETKDKDGKLSLRFPVYKELREIGKEVSYA